MYYCKECKKIINENDIEKYKEPSEAWGHTVYEDWWVCPDCGAVIYCSSDEIPCLNCNDLLKCAKNYKETEEPLCELGENYLDIIERYDYE